MNGCSSRARTRKVAEPIVARGRQGHVVGLAERQRVRSGHDVEQEREVAGGARHRTDDGEVVVDRQGGPWWRDHAAGRRQSERRLVRVDTAEVRGGAQRTGEVGAHGERAEPGRQGRRRSAGGPARRAFAVPRVVGGAVDLVEALQILQTQRDIGLAEHHRACGLEPRHLHRVLGRCEVPVLRHAPGRGHPGHVVALLDRDRNTQQRPILAPAERLVGMTRRRPGSIEVGHADRVDLPVVPLDPGDRRLGQFRRGHLTSAQRGRQLFGRPQVLIHGSDANGMPRRP